MRATPTTQRGARPYATAHRGVPIDTYQHDDEMITVCCTYCKRQGMSLWHCLADNTSKYHELRIDACLYAPGAPDMPTYVQA
jgi:hypothetical protein